jgi:threonylcarbamoyladenosine tRNA methylthiotransferase MtaB
LTELVARLAERGGAARFRLSSLEPMDCSREIVELAAVSEKIASHFHLPLQHASDEMLRQMRRPYSLADYRRLVDRIRERMPDAAIGSDVIAGFPGETERDAALNESYLRESPLTSLHVFPYSDRPGTAASRMPSKVPGSIIRERAQRLRQVGAALSRRFRESQNGRIRPALTIDEGTLAITDNYLKVTIPAGHSRNEWVRVRIAAGDAVLVGMVVNE